MSMDATLVRRQYRILAFYNEEHLEKQNRLAY